MKDCADKVYKCSCMCCKSGNNIVERLRYFVKFLKFNGIHKCEITAVMPFDITRDPAGI